MHKPSYYVMSLLNGIVSRFTHLRDPDIIVLRSYFLNPGKEIRVQCNICAMS